LFGSRENRFRSRVCGNCVPTGSSAANPSKSLFDRARPLKSSSYQILSEERARRIARQIAGFRLGHSEKVSASCPIVNIDLQYYVRCFNIREAINRKWTISSGQDAIVVALAFVYRHRVKVFSQVYFRAFPAYLTYLCLVPQPIPVGAHASCKESDASSGYEDVLRLAVSASPLLSLIRRKVKRRISRATPRACIFHNG